MIIDFTYEFKSSALLYVDNTFKCEGVDWLVRSHRRVSVGASRGPDLGRDKTWYQSIRFVGLITQEQV